MITEQKKKKRKKKNSIRNNKKFRKLYTLKQLEPTPILLPKLNKICHIQCVKVICKWSNRLLFHL